VIDDYLRTSTVNFAFINTVFAIDDFDSPLQPFIDDQMFFDINPKNSKRANFYVQDQKAELEDGYFSIG
jgi:hypothetical protein